VVEIEEYRLGGVDFDDFRGGVLYEHKGDFGGLINRDRRFYRFFFRTGGRDLLDQARRQIKAARGVPVVWRVGQHQLRAFRELFAQ